MNQETSSRQYVTRNLSVQADQAISKRFEGLPQVGPGSPKQSWLRALHHIAALDFEYSSSAYTLWQCALRNAELRKDDDIAKLGQIRRKLEGEQEEYATALEDYRRGLHTVDLAYVVYRLSNVIYYATQEYTRTGDISELRAVCEKSCARAGVPVTVALDCAKVKMWNRVSRGTNDLKADKDDEIQRIQRVLNEWQNS